MKPKRKPPPAPKAKRRKTKKADLPSVPEELLQQLFPGGFTLRDQANAIVAFAFRNGPIERLHAGITDEEMKHIMLDASEKIELLLEMRETDEKGYTKFLRGYNLLYCGKWER